jgi:glycosyltransferase involved in cell wall biosynthesis
MINARKLYAFAMPEVAPPPPRVAVIVPAYGVAHLVGEALASLQAQTMPDWECVVIDDGAPDDVAGAVAPFLADPRIRFLATANQGVSSARNAAIATTSAPLLVLLDGDDLLRPDYLATTVPLLERDPAIRLVTVNARIFGAVPRERLCFFKKQGTSDGMRGSLADVLDRSFGVYIGSTFRRADFDSIGGFDTKMAQSEDFDLWVRLMQLGGYAWYADSVLGEYRVRANSASANSARLLMGNIRTYEKARAALSPEAPEQILLARLIAESRDALDFEHAIDRVVDGDTAGGLADLRRLRRRVGGPIWAWSFALWRVLPGTARPMLAWRRRAHSRGGGGEGVGSLLGESIAL